VEAGPLNPVDSGVARRTEERAKEGGAEEQRGRGAEEQRSRGAEEQRSRGAEELRSRRAEELRSRGAEEQRSRGVKDQKSRGQAKPRGSCGAASAPPLLLRLMRKNLMRTTASIVSLITELKRA
jgi:hypothetical protein